MFGVMVRVNTTQNLKDRPARRQCTMTCDAHITLLIMAQFEPYLMSILFG